MTRVMCVLFVLLIACCSTAWSQSKSSFAATSYTLGGLCNVTSDPDAVCPSLDWRITDASGTVLDYNGSAGAAAHDEYGLLGAQGTAVVTAHFASASGAAASGAGARATFDDTLTFSGLNGPGPYFLVVHMNVLGDVGGGFLQGISSAEMSAVNSITAPSGTVECDLGSPNMAQGGFQANCDAKATLFTVNDVVSIHGALSIGANAVVPETTGAVTQNPQVNFYGGKGKYTGARYTVYIVDGKGRKVSKAKIITASGFEYPTR